MYKKFFGLKEKPFSITPDPDYLFLSENHRQALNHLLYGINGKEGFMVLTGEVGTGKTVLCRTLIKELNRKNVKTALILNPSLSEIELLKNIAEDLEITDVGKSKKEIIDALNRFLIRELYSGNTVAVIIDEAQNLSPEVLEEIRLLSNLETEKEKLLQIVLAGQPELEELLKMPALRQLNQRISISYRLSSLKKSELTAYIHHRLLVAGLQGQIKFSRTALEKVFSYSQGLPRLINLACERILIAAYAAQKKKIGGKLAKEAIFSIERKSKALISMFLSPQYLLAALLILSLPLVFAWEKENNNPIKKMFADFGKGKDGKALALPVEEKKYQPDKLRPEINETGFDADGIFRENKEGGSAAASLMTVLKLWKIKGDLKEKFQQQKKEDGKNFDFKKKIKIFDLETAFMNFKLKDLEILNYPAILELDAASGTHHYLVLLGFADADVILGDPVKGKTVCSRKELEERWKGNAIIPWKNFDGIKKVLKDKAGGIKVEMLQERLKSLGYFARLPTSGYYGGYTKKVVRDFQKKQGLEDTGLLDFKTGMLLYQVTEKDLVPKLEKKFFQNKIVAANTYELN